ncbi:hypothetical protein CYMTET_49620, partial [Cymbomonas tetramitiformis]
VGERGITISGGQKQRIAMARAAYSKPDVVILDDPLSAMDAHVGSKVFVECILQLWGELGCTVILITNQLWVCDRCDQIYLLDTGEVLEEGSYSDLMAGRSRFHELMMNVTGQDDNADTFAEADKENKVEEKKAEVEKKEEKEAEMEKEEETEKEAGGEKEVKKSEGEEKGKIMTKEQRSAGRIGMGTVVTFIYAADAPTLGKFMGFMTLLCPVMQWLVNWGLSKWSEAVTDSDTDSDADETLYLYLYLAIGVAFGLTAFLRAVSMNWFFVQACLGVESTYGELSEERKPDGISAGEDSAALTTLIDERQQQLFAQQDARMNELLKMVQALAQAVPPLAIANQNAGTGNAIACPEAAESSMSGSS